MLSKLLICKVKYLNVIRKPRSKANGTHVTQTRPPRPSQQELRNMGSREISINKLTIDHALNVRLSSYDRERDEKRQGIYRCRRLTERIAADLKKVGQLEPVKVVKLTEAYGRHKVGDLLVIDGFKRIEALYMNTMDKVNRESMHSIVQHMIESRRDSTIKVRISIAEGTYGDAKQWAYRMLEKQQYEVHEWLPDDDRVQLLWKALLDADTDSFRKGDARSLARKFKPSKSAIGDMFATLRAVGKGDVDVGVQILRDNLPTWYSARAKEIRTEYRQLREKRVKGTKGIVVGRCPTPTQLAENN